MCEAQCPAPTYSWGNWAAVRRDARTDVAVAHRAASTATIVLGRRRGSCGAGTR